MKSPELLELTASEPLTLDEEVEMQSSKDPSSVFLRSLKPTGDRKMAVG
jgi:hypothetical protein